MILLANGCSNTLGEELAYTKLEKNKLAYPVYIAKYFDMTCENISTGMCSNDYIVRTTIDWIETNDVRSEDLFVVIGWTSLPRKSFTNKDGNHFCCPGVMSSVMSQTNELVNYYKSWVLNDTYRPFYMVKHYHSIIYLSLYLKERKIKHVMVNTVRGFKPTELWQQEKLSEIKEYWEYYDNDYSLLSYAKKHNRPLKPKNHVDAQTHKFFSKDLIRFIKENELLQ